MILAVGLSEQILVPGRDGRMHRKPLIHGTPKVLMKDNQKSILVSWKFTCPLGIHCRFHGLTPNERSDARKAGLTVKNCVFAKGIRIHDSMFFFPFSLDFLITDARKLALSSNIPLQNAFRATYDFCKEMGFTDEEFNVICYLFDKFW